jgi:plastocyanin
LTIVAVNVLFNTSSLSAPAGDVTIVLDNQDKAVAHNIQFFSKGASIGMSEIKTGPATDTLSLGTLTPGSYSFKCDVHPQTMTGVLTVS